MKTNTLLLAAALSLAAVPAFAQAYRAVEDEPAEYRNKEAEREAYRRGYERGYDRGYAKGMSEGNRGANMAPPPPPPPPVALGPIRISGAMLRHEQQELRRHALRAPPCRRQGLVLVQRDQRNVRRSRARRPQVARGHVLVRAGVQERLGARAPDDLHELSVGMGNPRIGFIGARPHGARHGEAPAAQGLPALVHRAPRPLAPGRPRRRGREGGARAPPRSRRRATW